MSMSLRRTLFGLSLTLPLALGTGLAHAADPLLGAVIGATTGAVVGQAVGGRDGAVVGGMVGAATGAVVSTQRPRVVVGGAYAMGPMDPMTPLPAPARMTRVQYYDGGNIYYGPYAPPPRGPGQWRLMQDSWGNTFWQWEPAPVYLPPPVYSVPAYPPPPVYRGYYPPPSHAYQQTPRWYGNPPAQWADPHRRGDSVRAPIAPPPAYRPPSYQAPGHQPPGRNPSSPPPRYQPPPGR